MRRKITGETWEQMKTGYCRRDWPLRIVLVLVCLDHVASRIVNSNHSIM